MKFSIKDFFSKYDKIRVFLRIWSHLLKSSLMENFIFLCSVNNLFKQLLLWPFNETGHSVDRMVELKLGH